MKDAGIWKHVILDDIKVEPMGAVFGKLTTLPESEGSRCSHFSRFQHLERAAWGLNEMSVQYMSSR